MYGKKSSTLCFKQPWLRKHYSKNKKNKKGEKLHVSFTEVVRDYNMLTGGADLSDQLRLYNNVNLRSKTWCHGIFWDMMDFAFVSLLVIYNCLKPKFSVL